MSETEFAATIEAAAWEVVDNGPAAPEFEALAEQLANVTRLDESGYLTTDTGLVFEMEDGTRFVLTIQKDERR